METILTLILIKTIYTLTIHIHSLTLEEMVLTRCLDCWLKELQNVFS